jgi:hypothetical protein
VTQELPDVPDTLPDLAAEHTATVKPGWPLVRIHDLAGRFPREYHEPRWFGPHPDKGRFDHHPQGRPRDHAPDHGIIYTTGDDPTAPESPPAAAGTIVPGNALDVALAEFVQADTELVITAGLTLTVVAPTEPLQLLDVRSSWGQATRAGTHLSTAAHHRTQPWARAIRDAYPHLHGILYVPATGGRAVAAALNETAAGALGGGRVLLSRRLTDPAMLAVVEATAERLRFDVTVA